MRLSLLFVVIISSCTAQREDQAAGYFKTKGITTSAVLSREKAIVVAGESSLWKEDSPNKETKYGYLAKMPSDASQIQIYKLGDDKENWRVEHFVTADQYSFASGHFGENRIPFVAKIDQKMNVVWAMSSNQLSAGNESQTATNSRGELLISSKKPGADSYVMHFSLLGPDGKLLWVRQLEHVDQLSAILPVTGDNFLICFKQKGAYIDGETRKKYLLYTTVLCSSQGEIISLVSYILDNSLLQDFSLDGVVQTKNKNLYHWGSVSTNGIAVPFAMSSSENGAIHWAKTFPAAQNLSFKNSVELPNGDLIAVGDGYGRSGGFLQAGMKASGDIKWMQLISCPSYQQIVSALQIADQTVMIYDKTLQLAFYKINENGQSCLPGASPVAVQTKDFPVDVHQITADFTEDKEVVWTKCNVQMSSGGLIHAESDCSH